MHKFIWHATFIIEPSLRKSEILNGYQFELQNDGTMIVERTYETSSFDEEHPQGRGSEYAEETLARLDAQAIREIMLKRMIYQKNFFALSIRLKTHPELTNRQALIKAGVILQRPLCWAHDASCTVLDVEDSLANTQSYWEDGFKKTSKDQQAELLRIADWIERSYLEQDEIKSFILTWIAFNGFYSLFSDIDGKTRSDADKFEFLIQELVSTPDAKKIIRNIHEYTNNLKTFNITSESGKINFSQKLEAALKKDEINEKEILKLVVRCVYGVRKQVFHEAPKTDDVLDRVKTARSALLLIMTTCLKVFVAC